MKSYLLVITGSSSHPTLHHSFETTSDNMAKEYSTRQSRLIASPGYYSFALFRQADDQQALLQEWTVDLQAVATMKKEGRL